MIFVPGQSINPEQVAIKSDIQIVNLSSRKLNDNVIKLLEKRFKIYPHTYKTKHTGTKRRHIGIYKKNSKS